MPDLIAVTSFGPTGWDAYAKRGIGTFVKHFPGKVIVYIEDEVPANEWGDSVEWRNLFDVPGCLETLNWAQRNPTLCGIAPKGYTYNYDLNKFCRKVFAQVDAARRFKGLMYWLDADVRLLKDIPAEELEAPLRDVYTCFFGRAGFHVESGVVGWDTRAAINALFMDYYEGLFLNGNILQLPGFHDCWAYMATLSRIRPSHRNLSPYAKRVSAPIGQDYFRGYVAHDKGKRKFQGAAA